MRDKESSARRARRMEEHRAFVIRFAKRVAAQGRVCHVWAGDEDPRDWTQALRSGGWHWSGVHRGCHWGCAWERVRHPSTQDERTLAMCEAEEGSAEERDPALVRLVVQARARRWRHFHRRKG